MKKFGIIILGMYLAVFSACNKHDNTNNTDNSNNTAVLKKEKNLEMNQDTLDARIISEIMNEIIDRRSEISDDALTVISETQKLLQLIEANKKDKAIDLGHKLIGKLEVLLAKDPSASIIPVDVSFNKNELITDIETVREITKSAQEAMDKGYYQLAGNILNNLHSEMVINSMSIPTATYPEAIKVSIALLEEDKPEEAKTILQEVLGTVVIEKTVLPLPVLKAEQMIAEAALTDSLSHSNTDKALNLLKNAKYQLTLAEEMGYGKKDQEYKALSNAIDSIQKSVSNKKDNQSEFDSLKVKIRKFKERLFPKRNK